MKLIDAINPDIAPGDLELLSGRMELVNRTQPSPVEWIVRGYLAGSAWREYKETGIVQGHKLPAGLKLNDKLPEPLFTPTWKAESGHDEPVTWPEVVARLGEERAEKLRTKTLDIFNRATKHAHEKDLVLVDTKFEWGQSEGQDLLIDEILQGGA